MDMWVWIPLHTTYIPINNLLPADTMHGKSIPSRSTRKTIKLDHDLPTSSRPDDFHDTRVCSLVSRHHSTDYRFGTHGIFDRVLAFFPARLPLTLARRSRHYVSETLPSRAFCFFPSHKHVSDPGSRSRIDSLSVSVRRLALELSSSGLGTMRK
jgi:hypothetical protein